MSRSATRLESEGLFCVILGAGGHARVLVDALQACGVAGRFVALDPDPNLRGNSIYGFPIEGGDELLSELAAAGASRFIVGMGAVGDNRPRLRLFELGLAAGLQPFEVRHPSALCSSHARLGPGSQLLAGSIVAAEAEVGVNVIVNNGAIVEHDCRVGDHAHVASGSRLASTVYVGEGAHIGAGATIRQGVKVGPWAIVGAGAVVIRDVPEYATVVGVPAHALPPAKERA